jgi:hypothetical protein
LNFRSGGEDATIERLFSALMVGKAVVGVMSAAKSTHPPIKGVRQNNRMACVSGGWRFNP